MAGLHPPEFKSKMVGILDMRGRWTDNFDEVIAVMGDAAVEWRTVDQADELRSKSRGRKNKDKASSKFGETAKTSRGGKHRGKSSISMVYRNQYRICNEEGTLGCAVPSQKQGRRGRSAVGVVPFQDLA